MSGLTVIRVRHRYCLKCAYFACFRHGCWILYETGCFACFCIGACGLEIAKSREMTLGRYSIHFPKHSAMPGGCSWVSWENSWEINDVLLMLLTMMYSINNASNTMQLNQWYNQWCNQWCILLMLLTMQVIQCNWINDIINDVINDVYYLCY